MAAPVLLFSTDSDPERDFCSECSRRFLSSEPLPWFLLIRGGLPLLVKPAPGARPRKSEMDTVSGVILRCLS